MRPPSTAPSTSSSPTPPYLSQEPTGRLPSPKSASYEPPPRPLLPKDEGCADLLTILRSSPPPPDPRGGGLLALETNIDQHNPASSPPPPPLGYADHHAGTSTGLNRPRFLFPPQAPLLRRIIPSP